MVLPIPRIQGMQQLRDGHHNVVLHVALALFLICSAVQQVHSFHHQPALKSRQCAPTSMQMKMRATASSAATTHQCTDCDAIFTNRNALFKHIRLDNCDGGRAEEESPPVVPVRYSVALFFGFIRISPEEAGRVLLQAFFGTDNDDNDRELISSTQSTLAKQRHKMVQQESDCPSGMDTLIVNFFSASQQPASQIALELSSQLRNYVNHDTATDNNKSTIVLHGVRQLDPKACLHAEKDCTQLVYHFMVPVTWLPQNGNDIVAWYHESIVTGDCRKPRSERPDRTQTPASLKRFKDILRSVESAKDDTKHAPRFRSLGYKVPRPWHNFCDPGLRASPNHDVTKRIVDRARFLKFHYDYDDDDDDASGSSGELYIIYEFIGDAFLPQLVRRIVGTAVGMVNGWLPEDFMNISLSNAVVQDTPLAPAGYLYQDGARFHFAELSLKGVKLFDLEDTIRLTKSPEKWIQSQLLSKLKLPSESSTQNTTPWLDRLRDIVAPQICASQRLMNAPVLSNDGNLTVTSTTPGEYSPVLHLLRDMVEQRQWPATSVSRSSVIGTLADPTRAGSFTVVDQVNFDLTDTKLPKANAFFPELTDAVFQLQANIVDDNITSSHCAINCNAQFTPHVDSGRGSGQSLSTIVGLGDYKSGELVVEGEVCDIRYQPLQFDGWKLRHWTRPFSGERFSLVWFTPEGIERKN